MAIDDADGILMFNNIFFNPSHKFASDISSKQYAVTSKGQGN